MASARSAFNLIRYVSDDSSRHCKWLGPSDLRHLLLMLFYMLFNICFWSDCKARLGRWGIPFRLIFLSCLAGFLLLLAKNRILERWHDIWREYLNRFNVIADFLISYLTHNYFDSWLTLWVVPRMNSLSKEYSGLLSKASKLSGYASITYKHWLIEESTIDSNGVTFKFSLI